MGIPKSSLDNSFPDNSDFQLSGKDSLNQDGLTRKVISGKAVEGKQNAVTNARDNLLYKNGESIGSEIMDNVVVPAVRDLSANIVGSIFETIVDSITSFIYKDDPTRRPQVGGRYTRGGTNGYVGYSSIFNNTGGYYNVSSYGGASYNNSSQVVPNLPPPNLRSRYNNIILENLGEAETFVDDLLYTVNQYQSISVANVYTKLGWPSYDFQDTKWGWTPAILNKDTIIKRRLSGGKRRIILPNPVALEEI